MAPQNRNLNTKGGIIVNGNKNAVKRLSSNIEAELRRQLATVEVGEEVISSIGRGLCVLVGISKEDTEKEIDYLVRKVLNLRLFGEDERKWSSSVVDQGLEILCLSQITLYSTLKGNRMDFHNAMSPSQSRPLYQQFLDTMRQQYLPDKVKEGRFGVTCVVSINNDGPVTVILDSPQPKKQAVGDE